METVLMVVTLVSLTLAIGMSVLAWRLLREDRQRSDARGETLREMAAAPDVDEFEPEPIPEIRRAPPPRPAEPRRPVPPVRRAEPARPLMDKMRFASVDDDEPDSEWDAPLTPPTRPTGLRSPAPRQSTAYAPEPTFGATAEHGAPPRRWAALAAVAVIMAAAAGTVYVVYSPSAAGMIASGRAAVSPEAAPGSHPIELLSLRHSTDPDGAFTVTGLVQNPIDGRLARHIVAVVYLFDREGNYFATGKATLDFTALQPGEESPFVVRIPGAGPVSRYRVGFRSEEGGVVAHIDRRGQLPGGTTGDAIEARPTVTPSVATRRSEG